MNILVIANETVASDQLLDAVRGEAKAGVDLVTVLAPVNTPSGGYVVYEDTRRAAAGRRLDRTLDALHEAGIAAHGMVVETPPDEAVRDALATLEPPPDRIVVSTHPEQKSGWLRRNMVDKIRDAAGDTPVEHVVVDLTSEGGPKNVLVVANETVIGVPLLERIRERAKRGPASFLIIAPQSDPTQAHHPEAERRLRRALTLLRAEGIDVHGQVAHPDPFTAAMQAVEDERVDEIIVSTFSPEKSGWLRRDLIERLRGATNLSVEHVMLQEREPVT
jgi:methylmalonyl-CoA mutase cobalamin-binding subunit